MKEHLLVPVPLFPPVTPRPNSRMMSLLPCLAMPSSPLLLRASPPLLPPRRRRRKRRRRRRRRGRNRGQGGGPGCRRRCRLIIKMVRNVYLIFFPKRHPKILSGLCYENFRISLLWTKQDKTLRAKILRQKAIEDNSPTTSTSCTGTAHLSESLSLAAGTDCPDPDPDDPDPDDPEAPAAAAASPAGEGNSTSEALPATETHSNRSFNRRRRRCLERLMWPEGWNS